MTELKKILRILTLADFTHNALDMNFPEQILTEIPWSFYGTVYSSIDDFKTELLEEFKNYKPEDLPAELFEVVLNVPVVVIQYMIYAEDDEDEEDEPQVLIKASNGSSFTGLELLFLINNAVTKALEDEDNLFFEGLTFATDDDPEFPDGTPVYFLETGS